MLFLKIIFYAIITEITTKCYAADVQLIHSGAANAVPYNPTIQPSMTKCNVSGASKSEGKIQNYGLRLRLPFMDIVIQNQRNMRLLQERQKQLLFVLHGNELFQLFIGREEKRLSLIALLDGNVRDMEHIGAEIISWNDYLLLVVALEEYVEVYQIAEHIITERAKIAKDPKRSNETAPHFEPIQQLMLTGKYRKMYLAEPVEDRILLIMAAHFTKLHGQINTYEWINTYFEPVEELTLPPMSILSLLGKPGKYLMAGRSRSKSRTLLTMYEIEASTMHLKSRQTFTVDTRTPQLVTYHGKNYIISCSKTAKKCSIYKMSDGHFNVYRQRPHKDLNFTQLIAGAHFLVGTRLDEILVFPNIRLDCYTAFRTNETDVSAIISHVNEHGEDFILLNYKRPFNTLVRVIEVESDSGEVLGKILANGITEFEEMSQQNQGQHQFENTISSLRSMLLKRKPAMDIFQQITDYFAPKLKSLKLRNPVTLRTGNIGIVKVVGKYLRSPTQLRERVSDLSRRYGGGRLKREPRALPLNVTKSTRRRLRVKHLKVHNLQYKHNIIKGFHLDSTAVPMPILSIRSKLKAKVLQTPELLAHQNVRAPRQPSLGLFDFGVKSQRLRNLTVNTINGLPWSDFYDTIFLRNRDTKVEGRLVLQSMASVQHLSTPLLNGLVVDKLFNLVQPQVIYSDILIAGFFVTDLKADRINGLDFAKEIAFSGVDNVITTPVVMQQLRINGDLFLADNSTLPRLSNSEEENFQQIYTGKVVIKGSLTVNNLWKEETAQIMIDNMTVEPEELKQRYLLNKTEQTFTYPITFENARVDAPSFSTNYLNEQPTAEHLLKTPRKIETEKKTKPLMLIFMKAHIKGQLNCSSYNSRLAELSENAVRYGEVANITGTKHFKAPLAAAHLMTLEMNQLRVSDLVLKQELSKPLKLWGNKTFEKVLVTGDADIAVALNANYLNSLPLNELLNYDYHLENLTLPYKLYATNIVFHKINGISFDKVFMNFKIRNKSLVLHKDLIIEGNAKFGEELDVDLINNIVWKAYEQSLVRQHEDAIVNGTKQFLKEIVITKELSVPTWNNVKIAEVFDNILRKSRAQTISGNYMFDELSVTNVDVSVVNDMPVAAFIDRETPEIVIEGDIVVPKVVVHGDVQGSFRGHADLKKFVELIKDLPSKPWRNVHVLGNAFWNVTDDKESTQAQQLAYLYKNAVTTNGNHTISGNVRLRRPLISQMYTKANFPKGFDFAYIAKDALLRNTTTAQIITGEKFFARPLMLQNMSINGTLQAQQLNNIDILHLNASLYRLSLGERIMGPLHFHKAPIIGHLAVQSSVNGLQPAQIYHLANETLPPLSISQLVFDKTLQLQDMNDMSLDYLLRNRITKTGEALEVFGHLTFEHLVLDKEILLQSINGIPIDSLVFKQSPNLQAITGAKFINGDLVLAGPAHVMRLNNRELIESYQHSIFTNADYTFDNLTIEQATFERGLKLSRVMLDSKQSTAKLSKEMLAAPAVVGLKQSATKQSKRTNVITRALSAIDNAISNANNRTHLMYLDYDYSMQTVWQHPADNITIDKSFEFAIKRLTICARQMLQVQISLANQTIFLFNTTSNVIATKHKHLSVKVENYCKSKYRKVRSKVTLKSPTQKRTFSMKKFIENVEIFTPTHNQTYLLLHTVDLAGQHNEVRLLELLNSTNDELIDRQSLTAGIGSVIQLFQLAPNYTILVSSAVVKNYPAVSIYTFSLDTQEFALTQVIDGDYDIIEAQQVATARYQLLLSCRGCQRLSIYEHDFSAAGSNYSIFQFVKLHQRVDKLLPFSLTDNSRYLLVLSEHDEDFYHLYSYSNIQGWQHFTYGYFHNIQWALPLVTKGQQLLSKDDMLLLLCGSGSKQCGLVKTVVQ